MTKIKEIKGFTLVEVIMVIIILGILASIAMKTLDSGLQTTRFEETKRELKQLAYAISGNPELFSSGSRSDYGYVGDVGAMPSNLDALASDPGYSTWKGPYISSDFLSYADDFKKDSWGQYYIYTGTNIIKSVGSVEDTIAYKLTGNISDFLSNTVSGQITDAAGNPPGSDAGNIAVTLTYPNGSGGYKDSVLAPNASGNFSYLSHVPIGNHRLQAVNSSSNDTLVMYVSVFPKSEIYTTLRFPGALWSAQGGGGSGSSAVSYVDGSAQATGGGYSDIEFDIRNDSEQPITISWIKVSYDAVAYFQQVKWDGGTVFNSNNPRAGSDEEVGFSSSRLFPNASSAQIQLNNFKTTASGGGSSVNMQNQDITVEFSDGSIIVFNTGS